jgi:hypothetical protein
MLPIPTLPTATPSTLMAKFCRDTVAVARLSVMKLSLRATVDSSIAPSWAARSPLTVKAACRLRASSSRHGRSIAFGAGAGAGAGTGTGAGEALPLPFPARTLIASE